MSTSLTVFAALVSAFGALLSGAAAFWPRPTSAGASPATTPTWRNRTLIVVSVAFLAVTVAVIAWHIKPSHSAARANAVAPPRPLTSTPVTTQTTITELSACRDLQSTAQQVSIALVALHNAISVDATTKRIHGTVADFASLQAAAVRQVIAGRQAIDNYENFGGTAPTAFNNDVNQLLSSDLLVLKQAPVTASAESAAIWDAWRQLSDYATDADNVSKIHC